MNFKILQSESLKCQSHLFLTKAEDNSMAEDKKVNKITPIDEISDLTAGAGSPFDIGASEGLVKEIIDRLKAEQRRKPICVIADWTWVDFRVTENDRIFFERQGNQPHGVYSNHVIHDELHRANPGECIRSTALVDFRENCIFETRNTIYILQGPGKRFSMRPAAFLSIFF